MMGTIASSPNSGNLRLGLRCASLLLNSVSARVPFGSEPLFFLLCSMSLLCWITFDWECSLLCIGSFLQFVDAESSNLAVPVSTFSNSAKFDAVTPLSELLLVRKPVPLIRTSEFVRQLTFGSPCNWFLSGDAPRRAVTYILGIKELWRCLIWLRPCGLEGREDGVCLKLSKKDSAVKDAFVEARNWLNKPSTSFGAGISRSEWADMILGFSATLLRCNVGEVAAPSKGLGQMPSGKNKNECLAAWPTWRLAANRTLSRENNMRATMGKPSL